MRRSGNRTFEGGGGGKVEVKDKLLKLRGAGFAIRRTQQAEFRAERFYVEATLAKVGPRTPQLGEEAFRPDSR